MQVRPLRGGSEVSACQSLQCEIWGQAHQLPASVFVVLDKIGGILLGAFDAHDLVVGFSLSFPGIFEGETIQWSDMLAVRADWRDRGVGRALKRAQRDAARAAGIDTIMWTFDPLQSRNAWFNFGCLGVTASHYVEDMYGAMEGMFEGLPSDRLIVRWRAGDVPAAPAATLDAFLRGHDGGETAWVEIPHDIGAIKSTDAERARRCRLETRHAFQQWLSAGYEVVAFQRFGDRGFYRLGRPR